MITIHRFELKDAINNVFLPIGSTVLSVGITKDSHYETDENFHTERVEQDVISLWIMMDDSEATTEKRKFLVFGTGADMDNTINSEVKYIGTVQKKNTYAFHVFEAIN